MTARTGVWVVVFAACLAAPLRVTAQPVPPAPVVAPPVIAATPDPLPVPVPPPPQPAATVPVAELPTADPVKADAPKADAPKADPLKSDPAKNPLYDSMHRDEEYGFKSLFDSLHQPETGKKKHWYENLNIRGYSQFRFGRTVEQNPDGAEPNLLADRSINGNAENFSIRRNRIIIFGDVSEHLFMYIQPDFAANIPGSTTSVFFAQLRDLYGDVYVDTDKVNRFRVGLSKVPFGFENMQSSQNRVPLDRTDAINTAVSPNERDVGVFYYWTPVEKQKLMKDLVDGGLKGSGNYGIFGLGVYNGQGGQLFEQNLNLSTVARATWPFQLASGQVVEVSAQAYTGEYVVEGSPIRPLGFGSSFTPTGTRTAGERTGQRDQRIAGTFVWYPQPFGFQAEWNVGEGPGLNPTQTAVVTRPLTGGYAMMMYKYDSEQHGIFTPYGRYSFYKGGYRSIANAPYGSHDQWDIGVEWQLYKEMELTLEYSIVNGVNLNAIDKADKVSYRNFDGGVLRLQCQFNY